jgi:hypothetical protein
VHVAGYSFSSILLLVFRALHKDRLLVKVIRLSDRTLSLLLVEIEAIIQPPSIPWKV